MAVQIIAAAGRAGAQVARTGAHVARAGAHTAIRTGRAATRVGRKVIHQGVRAGHAGAKTARGAGRAAHHGTRGARSIGHGGANVARRGRIPGQTQVGRAQAGSRSKLGNRFHKKLQDQIKDQVHGGRDQDGQSPARPGPARKALANAGAGDGGPQAGAAGAAGAGAALAAGDAAATNTLRSAGQAGRTAVHTVQRFRKGLRKFTRWIPGHKRRRWVWRLLVVLPLTLLLLSFATALASVEDEEQQNRQQQQTMNMLLAMCGGGGGMGVTGPDGTPSVMGSSTLTAAQLQGWWQAQDRREPLSQIRIADLAALYIEVGQATGVRGDVAFAQAVMETDFFTNPDSRINNFAGINHPSGAASGDAFSSPREGVKAHLDLLKSYADGSGPGRAQTWGEVGNDWSGTDTGAQYWAKVMSRYGPMLRHAGVEAPSGGGSGGGSSGGAGSGSGGEIPAGMDLERALASLRKVESGSYRGDYTAENRWGATGAYSFLRGTWGNYRGYARAKDAPPEVQDAKAREHVQELLRSLEGPWQREVALGWLLGAADAAPFMDMPDSDPRWEVPQDGNNITAREYLRRFEAAYEGATGGSGAASGEAGLCASGAGGAGVPTTVERQEMIDRAKTWLTASNGGPVPYCMCGEFQGWRPDCSGFVSFVWQLEETKSYTGTNTVGLQEYAEQITREELQPGDIMLRPLPGARGHVAIFERWDQNDPNLMWIIHQTPPHTTYERVSYDNYVSRGFNPYRRTGVE